MKKRRQYNEAKIAFSTNGSGTTEYLCVKKKKKRPTDIIPLTKINSKSGRGGIIKWLLMWLSGNEPDQYP